MLTSSSLSVTLNSQFRRQHPLGLVHRGIEVLSISLTLGKSGLGFLCMNGEWSAIDSRLQGSSRIQTVLEWLCPPPFCMKKAFWEVWRCCTRGASMESPLWVVPGGLGVPLAVCQVLTGLHSVCFG